MAIDDTKKKQNEELRKLVLRSRKVLRITEEDLRDTGKTAIDNGNFGNIYKGDFRGNLVAIKVLNQNNRLSNYRELICLMECRSPNIVGLIGAGPSPTGKNLKFIVIEFARNSSLEHLRTARFEKRVGKPWQVEYTMSHAFLWFLHAANGLEYLHEHCNPPMIHRDIKPANMLLFDDCRSLKLCDFGTTREEDEDVTSHQGSVRYMAPEVFEPRTSERPYRYDRSADIYSLCASFWEVFTRSDYPRSFQPIEDCPTMVHELLRRGLDRDTKGRPKITDIVRFLQFIVDKICELRPENCNLEFPSAKVVERQSTVTSSVCSTVTDSTSSETFGDLPSDTNTFCKCDDEDCRNPRQSSISKPDEADAKTLVGSSTVKPDDEHDKTIVGVPTQGPSPALPNVAQTPSQEPSNALPTGAQTVLSSQISYASSVSDSDMNDSESTSLHLATPSLQHQMASNEIRRRYTRKNSKTADVSAISHLQYLRSQSTPGSPLPDCRRGFFAMPDEMNGRWTPDQRHMRKPVDKVLRSRTPDPSRRYPPPLPPKRLNVPSATQEATSRREISDSDIDTPTNSPTPRRTQRPLPPRASPSPLAKQIPESSGSSNDVSLISPPQTLKPARSESDIDTPMNSPILRSPRRPLPPKNAELSAASLSQSTSALNKLQPPRNECSNGLLEPPNQLTGRLSPGGNHLEAETTDISIATKTKRSGSMAPQLPPREFKRLISQPAGDPTTLAAPKRPPELPPKDKTQQFKTLDVKGRIQEPYRVK